MIKEKLQELELTRVAFDLDGTVPSCGDKVRWAHSGYSPQNRHAKSYFPILCHFAQTGHLLRVVNRPGNIHDANWALMILKTAVEQMKSWLPKAIIEVRMDSAFFEKEIITYIEQSDVEYAIKVPEKISNKVSKDRHQLDFLHQRMGYPNTRSSAAIETWARIIAGFL